MGSAPSLPVKNVIAVQSAKADTTVAGKVGQLEVSNYLKDEDKKNSFKGEPAASSNNSLKSKANTSASKTPENKDDQFVAVCRQMYKIASLKDGVFGVDDFLIILQSKQLNFNLSGKDISDIRKFSTYHPKFKKGV